MRRPWNAKLSAFVTFSLFIECMVAVLVPWRVFYSASFLLENEDLSNKEADSKEMYFKISSVTLLAISFIMLEVIVAILVHFVQNH